MANKAKKIPFAKLRGLRAEQGLSQANMARIVGISATSYVSRENGRQDFKSTEMGILKRYFKMSVDDLFFD